MERTNLEFHEEGRSVCSILKRGGGGGVLLLLNIWNVWPAYSKRALKSYPKSILIFNLGDTHFNF